ncbi:MAG TPA: antitoxin [Ilumatobacteraceae bacterium]|nr:antitoxin [Ilumatobacteraceae bacterium]
MGFFDKIKNLLKGNKSKVEQGLDKAADTIDSKTGGKYSEKIDSGVDKAKDVLNKLDK